VAKESIPELELANVRTRERITETVEDIRRRADVPARTRLAVAKTRQRWHRDPTPLVAMAVTAGAGIAAIVVGLRIGGTPAARLDAADVPMKLPVFKPVKPGKDGTTKGVPAFSRKEDKANPALREQKAAEKRAKKAKKQARKG
jgi:hypothetical protein